MGHFAQKLAGVAFGLYGIVFRGLAFQNYPGNLYFERLFGLRGQHHCAPCGNSRTHPEAGQAIEISAQILFIYQLNGVEMGTVMQGNEAEVLFGCGCCAPIR